MQPALKTSKSWTILVLVLMPEILKADKGEPSSILPALGSAGVRRLIEPVIIELNLDTVQRLRAEGTLVVYGNANQRDILKEAGAERAIALIFSAAGMHGSEEVIRLARELNPRIRVFARTEYVRELPALRKAGAEAVFSGEDEVALATTEFILVELGATSKQIAREREKVRSELFECHQCL
jgi:CPA2 family monovalent cation:H+ antiporter-2